MHFELSQKVKCIYLWFLLFDMVSFVVGVVIAVVSHDGCRHNVQRSAGLNEQWY